MERVNKLVIIDDDPIHNFIAKITLDKLNVADKIRIFNNPSDAIIFFEESCLKKTKGICPEMVLLDFQFPTMNAIDLLHAVIDKGLDIYAHFVIAIVSTVEIRREDKEVLKKLGVNEFLIKPITEDTISYLFSKC
jgi:response regulator of citrate/malate metabolism